MEVKEAADLLDNLVGMVEDSGGRDYDTALKMGIEALTAHPEIIRCKDCADYDTSWIPQSVSDRYYCPTMDSFMPEDGFCSFAERRTDG